MSFTAAIARETWRRLSHTQRRALVDAEKHGGRPLCSRGVLIWSGGASDPETAAAVTKWGRFVLQRPETT